MPATKIRKLHARALEQLTAYLELARDPVCLDLLRTRVSDWNVAQHLEHLALVDRSILKRLEATAEPHDEPNGKATPIGRVMLFFGVIPRGRGKAPIPFAPRETDPKTVRGTETIRGAHE